MPTHIVVPIKGNQKKIIALKLIILLIVGAVKIL